MKSYVVGDVHGQLDHLKVLLNEIQQKANGKEYELIFAGDILDKGKDSYATFQFMKSLGDNSSKPKFAQKLKTLMGKGGPQVTHILGNHDDYFSGSKSGTEQLRRSIESDENGVLRTMESVFDYYATTGTALPAASKNEVDPDSYELAQKAYRELKNLDKYKILENTKYKNLFESVKAYEKEARETLDAFNRWGDEDVIIATGSRPPSRHTTQDESNIFFLYQALTEMKEYFSKLPLIAQRGNFVITHSGFIPTEKDKHGNPTRILSDEEIKADSELRDETLWCRDFSAANGQPCSTPQKKVLGNMICHGHTVNASNEKCAATDSSGSLAAINLDAGAYSNPPSLRCVDLQSGRILSVTSETSQSESLATIKELQVKKQARLDEETATLLSKKTVPLATDLTSHKSEGDKQN